MGGGGGGWAVVEVAEAVLPPSQMSGLRAYGYCVAMIVIVLRSDNCYLQQTRDMEVALDCSGKAEQNDSLVDEHVQVVLLPRRGARAAREPESESHRH